MTTPGADQEPDRSLTRSAEPVSRPGPFADEDSSPGGGMALCLSGGGYRAMVFHLGVLWRLNDAGLLGRLAGCRASRAAPSPRAR